MSIAQFKYKFDEYYVYFPSWIKIDEVFNVEIVRNSIGFKVKSYAPII